MPKGNKRLREAISMFLIEHKNASLDDVLIGLTFYEKYKPSSRQIANNYRYVIREMEKKEAQKHGNQAQADTASVSD